MRVAVLGGGGLTGRGAVRQLAAGGVFDEVVVADLDAELAERAAKAGEARVTPRSVDLRDRRAT